jgi:predicted enzyme related to lactoylglutathione lyase
VAHGVRLRIFARDPERARVFYAQVFGWSLPADRPICYWVITSGDDARLGVDGPDHIGAGRAGMVAVPTVHVADLAATTAAALAAGGEVLVPRIPLPGVGWLVYLADTEGNVIGIMQDDPRAAWPQAPTPRRPGVGRAGPDPVACLDGAQPLNAGEARAQRPSIDNDLM